MRYALLAILAATGCTVTVGHAPDSTHLMCQELQAERKKLEAEAGQAAAFRAKAGDLASALSEVGKLPQYNRAVNRVLLRNDYPAVDPMQTPTPKPKPKPTPKE